MSPSTLALRTGNDGCIVAGRVRLYLLSAHGLQQRKRMQPLPSFLTHSDGCTVADSVRCRPSIALFRQLPCQLSTLVLRTSTDGCTVAGHVRPYLLCAHGLHQSKGMLLLPPFTHAVMAAL